MDIKITVNDYVDYLCRAYSKINSEKDYLSELDAATGDGDHWANMNMGFSSLNAIAEELRALSMQALFSKVAVTLMSVVGGSSGVLYASAYMEAAKVVNGMDCMDSETLCQVLEAMLNGIMKRGNAQPGMKTMVDTLSSTVICYRRCLADGTAAVKLLPTLKKAAYDGQMSTMGMEAVKGRASYRTDKGVGHLDPGAVSMYYQIEALIDVISENCII